jgi:hypothetical protein
VHGGVEQVRLPYSKKKIRWDGNGGDSGDVKVIL